MINFVPLQLWEAKNISSAQPAESSNSTHGRMREYPRHALVAKVAEQSQTGRNRHEGIPSSPGLALPLLPPPREVDTRDQIWTYKTIRGNDKGSQNRGGGVGG